MRVVHAIDTATGKIVGSFESGDQPHESNYSKDGQRIYHASIGKVFVPTTASWLDWLKGDRWFQIVDAKTLQVIKRIDIGQKLAAQASKLVEQEHKIQQALTLTSMILDHTTVAIYSTDRAGIITRFDMVRYLTA